MKTSPYLEPFSCHPKRIHSDTDLASLDDVKDEAGGEFLISLIDEHPEIKIAVINKTFFMSLFLKLKSGMIASHQFFVAQHLHSSFLPIATIGHPLTEHAVHMVQQHAIFQQNASMVRYWRRNLHYHHIPR